MKYFGKGIAVASGFDLNAKAPLDARTVVSSKTILDSMDDIKKYNGMEVFVENENRTYKLVNNAWQLVVDQAVNDLTTGGTTKALTAEQGKVLNTALNTHKGDANIHVTSADKTKWNDKYTKSEADAKYATQTNLNNVSNTRATGSRISGTTAAAGWYRIAKTSASINNCLGDFTITAALSGKHSLTSLTAGISYGVTPSIIQNSHVEYSSGNVTKARIVYHTSYNGNYAYLEVYVSGASSSLKVEMHGYEGWILMSPALQSSIPEGYTSKEITLVKDRIVGNVQGSLTGNASTATKLSTARTINGVAFDGTQNITITANPNAHTHTKSQITDFPTSLPANGGNADTVDGKHVNDGVADALWTGTKITAELNKKAASAGSTAQDFNAKNLTVAGSILPTGNGTQDIGSPTKRFGSIYVNEAHLASNTLYIDDVPVIGSTADSIDIKADPNQGIMVRTTGLGATKIASENDVQITSTGTNADVNLVASGTGSKVNMTGSQQVNLTAPDINMDGNTVIKKNLVVAGDLTVQGTNTILNTTTLAVEDNIIEINKGQTGSGVSKGTAGISVNRGDASAYHIVFDEADDLFKVGMTDQLETIASRPWADNKFEPKITKNTAFNKNFGTAAGTVAQGNHNHDTAYLGKTATAAAATKLATAKTINGVAFDGTANITVTADPNNHASNKVTAMTGYTKATTASAISATDSLNTAIGKLEKAIEGTSASGHTHSSANVNSMSGYAKASAAAAIATSDTLNAAIGKLEKGLDGKAASSHTHAASQITGLPTSLPANGGNADTVDGKHASDFALASHGTHVTYATTAPLVAGTASAGTSNDVARGNHVHPAQTSVSGNAGTATKLATARTISLAGDVTGSATFDGSANISITATVADNSHNHTNYAPTSHNHNAGQITAMTGYSKPSSTSAISASDSLNAAIGKLEKALEGAATGGHTHAWDSITGKPSTFAPSTHTHNYAGSSSAGGAATTALACTGNSATATKLATVRTINGTNFDGTASITTTKWGTARTLSLTGAVTGSVSMDGSGNVSLATSYAGRDNNLKSNGSTYKVIDLSSSTYNQNTYYPVVGSSISVSGFTRLSVRVSLDSGTKPTWSTHNSGFSCHLDLLARGSGWGTNSGETIVLCNTYNHTSSNPVGYSQMTSSSFAVFWLRGGGKYYVYSENPISWSIKTSSFTNNKQTVAPTTTYPGVSYTKTTMGANIDGNAGTATKLQTARTISLAGDVTGSASFDGSANVSITATVANDSHTHAWANITGKPSTFAPSAHGNHVPATETANNAKFLRNDNTWAVVTPANIGAAAASHTHSYAPSTHNHNASQVTAMTGYAKASAVAAISASDSLNTAIGKLERALDGKQAAGSYAPASHTHTGYAASDHTHSGYAASSHTHAWGNITGVPVATSSANGLMPSGDKAKLDTIGGIVTISKSLTLKTAWIDTGIQGTNLGTGSYVVQISGMTSAATNTYNEIFTGFMSWYADGTNNADTNEIILHAAGHATNSRHLYLRTVRQASGVLKLQVAFSADLTTATNVTFKFRKLI